MAISVSIGSSIVSIIFKNDHYRHKLFLFLCSCCGLFWLFGSMHYRDSFICLLTTLNVYLCLFTLSKTFSFFRFVCLIFLTLFFSLLFSYLRFEFLYIPFALLSFVVIIYALVHKSFHRDRILWLSGVFLFLFYCCCLPITFSSKHKISIN